MGYLPWNCGYQRLTSSGVVSDSGKPILIYGFEVTSGATVANPYFINGTAASAGNDVAFRGSGLANTSQVVSIPAPVSLPKGCYVSFDANTSAVTIFYSLNSVTS